MSAKYRKGGLISDLPSGIGSVDVYGCSPFVTFIRLA
jgi:hypothetical protein